MKKIIAIIAVIGFVASVSSCKTHEKCPAYGKVSPAKSNTVNA